VMRKQIWICMINHNNQHWQLLVLFKPGRRGSFGLFMDSMISQHPDGVGETRPPINWDLVIAFAKVHIESVCAKAGVIGQIHFPTLKLCLVPTQPNSFDCGVFSMLNLKNVLFHIEELKALQLATCDKLCAVDCRWWYSATEGTNFRKYLLCKYGELCDQYAS